jgi:hypothetical protein
MVIVDASGTRDFFWRKAKRMLLTSLLWRIPVLLLSGSLLVACTMPAPGTQTRVQTTPPANTPTEARARSICQTKQLTLAYTTSLAGLANRSDEFSLQNISTAPCSLTGYPQIQLLLANHQPTPTHVIQAPSGYFFPATLQVKTISLPPGGRAFFVVSWVAGTCAQSTATAGTSVQVTPPGDTGSLTTPVPTALDGGIDVCGQITVSPVSAATILPPQ